MKYILSLILCLFVGAVYADPQHHKPVPNKVGPNHVVNQHYTTVHHGWKSHTWKGTKYNHYCFKSSWKGWSKKVWCNKLGFFIFWSPHHSCYYQYVETDNIYIPIDAMVTEDFDDVVDDN